MSHKKYLLMGFLALVLLVSFPLVAGETAPHTLFAKTYKGGGVSFEDDKGLVGVLEPVFFTLDGKKGPSFSGGRSSNPNSLEGTVQLGKDQALNLKGSIQISGNGLEIRYVVTPSYDITLKRVCACLFMPYADWIGARCQNGFYAEQVTPQGIVMNGEEKDNLENFRYQCLAILGPSLTRSWLYLKVDGSDQLSPSFQDLPGQTGSFLETQLIDDRPDPEKPWICKAGVERVLEFTLSFSRPIQLSSDSRSLDEFLSLKKKMLDLAGAKPSGTSPRRSATPEIDPLKAWLKPPPYPDYKAPKDAQAVDMYVDDTLGQPHIYVPVEFKAKGKTLKGWLLWDTGWKEDSKDPVDLQVDTELLGDLGLKKFKPRFAKRGYVDVGNGRGKTLDVRQFYVSNNRNSDAGPVRIVANIGSIHLDNLHLLADSSVDDVVRFSNKYYSFKKQPLKVLGAVTTGFLKRHLVSLDFKNQKIFVRPLGSKRRTFFVEKPLGQVACKFLNDILFLPVTINEDKEGWAQFDTGSPFVGLDSVRLDPCVELPIRSFTLGSYDLSPKFQSHPPMFWRHLANVAMIGNDVLRDLFLTLDPRDKMFYIERDGELSTQNGNP